MNRQARILRVARRTLWGSLSPQDKLAAVFTKLASNFTDSFGKVIYGYMALKGLEGLPEIKGQPANEYAKGMTINQLLPRLPQHYGRELGAQTFATMMRRWHNPAKVEDAMAEFMARFIDSGHRHFTPTTIKQGVAFVLTSVSRVLIDQSRKKTEVSDEMDPNEEGDSMHHEVHVPSHEEGIGILQELAHSPKLVAELNKIHPFAANYVKGMVEGYTEKELAEQGGYSYHYFSGRVKPKIFEFLRDNMGSLVG